MGSQDSFLVPFLILACAVILMSAGAGCTTTPANPAPGAYPDVAAGSPDTTVERVEVIHFHPAQQCYSCRTLGEYAKETVNSFFAPELTSGKLVFREVNYQLPENADLVKKYEVTGSSLWIGVYDASGFHKEQDLKVWYKINNETEFAQYLHGVIRDRLNGVPT